MSLSSYKSNQWSIYLVGWSVDIKGKRHSDIFKAYTDNEETALEYCKRSINYSPLESFRMRVVGRREYER